MNVWTVVTASKSGVISLAVFDLFDFAAEYCAFAVDYDKEILLSGWTTYIVEGDFFHV